MGNPSTVVIIAEGTTANYSEMARARAIFVRMVNQVEIGNVPATSNWRTRMRRSQGNSERF
jgi:hypothetical protein